MIRPVIPFLVIGYILVLFPMFAEIEVVNFVVYGLVGAGVVFLFIALHNIEEPKVTE